MSTAAEVAADLLGLAEVAQTEVRAVVVFHTALMLTEARRNASQPRTAPRPRGPDPEGPRALTGSFRAGINSRVTTTATGVVGEVGSSDVRARRLELGFSGVDSAGRHFHQVSYPWAAPALQKVEPRFLTAMEAVGVPK